MIVISNLFSPSDASKPVFGWRNVVDAADIVVDSENANFPASNMANSSTALRWLAITAAAQTITLTVDSEADYIAIARHNLGTSGMSVLVEGNSTPAGAFSDLAQSFTPTDDGIIIVRFEPTTVAEVRISLGAGTAFPSIAVLFCGALTIMEKGITPSFTPPTLGKVYDIVNATSENGQHLGRIVKSETRKTAVRFVHLSKNFYRNEIDPFVANAALAPFFFAWSPVDWPNETLFSWMSETPEPSFTIISGEISVSIVMQGISGIEGITGSATPAQTLIQAVTGAAQTADHLISLDAGDSNSFNVAGGKWLDTSGNGNDFDLGTDETEEAGDPILSGPAGAVRPSSFWTFPSGPTDLFELTAASNPAFIDDMHKAAAAFTVLIAVRMSDVTTKQHIFATSDDANDIGIRLLIEAGDFDVAIDDGSGGSAFNPASLETVTVDTWHILGLCIDEAGGASASWSFNNGSFNTFNGAYTTPSAAAATNLARIANRAALTQGLVIGGNLGLFGIWDRALTTAQFDEVYNLLSDRF